MVTLLNQQLTSPELSSLKHVLVELQSHAVDPQPLMEQIEFLQEAKIQIKRLSPRVDVTVELICVGDHHHQIDIPASSMTGFRIVRFDKSCEGEGHSTHDILRWKEMFQGSHADQQARKILRDIWQVVVQPRGEGPLNRPLDH